MGAYIVRKLLYGIAVLWGVATLVFFLFNILPGDPAQMMLGQRADQESVNAIREELGRHLGGGFPEYFAFGGGVHLHCYGARIGYRYSDSRVQHQVSQ